MRLRAAPLQITDHLRGYRAFARRHCGESHRGPCRGDGPDHFGPRPRPHPSGWGHPPLSGTACGAWQGHPLGGGRRFPCRLSATTPAGRESLLTEKGSEPCLAHAPGGRRGPVPRALVSGWCAVLAVVPLRSPSPGAVWRTPACHECEPLAVRTPACGFEWRAIPLAGWLSGFEPSHIGRRGVPRGGWVGGKPSLPGAACSALGVVAALQEWCSWEEVPPFRSPPARRETHTHFFGIGEPQP